GQNELLEAISGEDPRAPAASVRIDGHDAGGTGVARRRARGLAFVPEERLGRAAVPTLGLHLNTLLTTAAAPLVRRGLIDARATVAHAARIIAQYDVRGAGPRAPAQSLSGGNLQKFVVGRELIKSPAVLVLAQPTWGVDVGAAARIRAELVALRDAGAAVLVVSEELDELFEVCDALHVIANGRLSPRIAIGDASVERIGELMGGAAAPAAAATAGAA
ncbi:MAG TPA: ABC transporter ATP-binding protein, partial [Burkholderiaceae bacterium]|nr:ABC transporter ATP-binding protein [Burkholderiaceae bacterium]